MNEDYQICDIESVECIGEFDNEYVYDMEMDTEDCDPVFFANDILIHNSCYVSLEFLNDHDISLKDDGKVSDDFLRVCCDIESFLNQKCNAWARKSLWSQDPRLVFKREAICDYGIFVGGKNYVLHVLDDEGVPVNKFKYKGVAVVKTTMPKDLKPYVKKIIETMISTQSSKATNDVYLEAYDTFKKMDVKSIYRVSGINNYEQFVSKCNGFSTVKGMPAHVKAAYFHDLLVDKLSLGNKYEKFKSGEKVKIVHLKTPNKYGIDIVGFKGNYPKEFSDVFDINYEEMFNKILFSAIEKFYEVVNWKLRKPNENVKLELEDFLSDDYDDK